MWRAYARAGGPVAWAAVAGARATSYGLLHLPCHPSAISFSACNYVHIHLPNVYKKLKHCWHFSFPSIWNGQNNAVTSVERLITNYHHQGSHYSPAHNPASTMDKITGFALHSQKGSGAKGWQCFAGGKKKHFAVVSTTQNNNPFCLIAKSRGENGPMLSPAVICVLLGCQGSAGGQALFFCWEINCGSCSIFSAFVEQKWRATGHCARSAFLCCWAFLS